MVLDIAPGESRGNIMCLTRNSSKQKPSVRSTMRRRILFDNGAEVSILDTAFAGKVGCYVDDSQTLQCEEVGKSPYMAEERTRLKITLAGSLVYFFDAWVGPPTGGQDLILVMDFMVPAGIRLDLADGTVCLPDEVRIQLAGRRPLYGDKVERVTMGGYYEIDTGGSEEVRLRTGPSDRQKLWVTRGYRWVLTFVAGPRRSCYLCRTSVSERKLILHVDTKIAMWLTGDRVLHLPGYVSVGSRRYAEWQNLAYQATTDENGMTPKQEEVQGPAVERPLYPTPTSILKRPPICPLGTAAAGQIMGRDRGIESLCNAQGLQLPSTEASYQRLNTSANQCRDQQCFKEKVASPGGLSDCSNEHKKIPTDNAPSTHSVPVDPGDEAVCIKESVDLYAEDVEGHLAVLPEVTPTTEEVKIKDIQVGNPNDNTQEHVDRLKHIIWRRRHLLIGKGNALPPTAKGAICDIDVGNAKPVAQRVRKVAPQFREKLFQLIKGLLSAKIIQHSTSPWASPIVVIIKKNGIDIRLCIDYRLVNSLTRLMVYPMPLINDLLDDLDKSSLRVDKLLDACDEWNLPISVAKSFWDLKKLDYLVHRISAGGMEARPKDLSSLADLPFPATLRSMQSFLGSLNYYSRFIEDFAIYASILYELREIDFFEARRQANTRLESDDQDQRDKWTRTTKAFVVLKDKIINAPILTHFDPD
ncbi:unnamed protein product [Phytophthora fragariaefolia]|uniref:Unnamed protein product n=1 Tax=Phytophthora fragariaefolia TaxID=1490495 RepID=A0A9W7D078_9STRA|nr:unnamed protein product [Phytophthora fragariaefolia]